jgi:ectoine hydroxylase-related dioxygenase (phytanoyl-CoA dioxygenase family)
MICPIPVLPGEDVKRFRTAVEELESGLGRKLLRMDNCHLFFRWAYELALHPRVLDVMEELLGRDIFVHSTRIFCKPAGDGSFVSWHQDGRYSSLNSKPAPSAWIALTDSVPENGCVRVIPGSHRGGVLLHEELFAPGNLLNHGEVVKAEIDEAAAVNLALRAGEMSLHDVNLIHGSLPNASGMKRLGFAISFITPATPASHMPVVRARGNSQSHGFTVRPETPSLSTRDAIAAHAEFIASRNLSPPKLKEWGV